MIMEKDKGQREAKHIKEILLTRSIDWKVRKTFLRHHHHHHYLHYHLIPSFYSSSFLFVLPCCISIFQNIFVFALLYFSISKYPGFCLVVFQYFKITLFLPCCISIFQNIFVLALLYFNISKFLWFCLVVFQYFKALLGIGFGDQVSLVGAGAASSLMVSAIMSKISSTNWLQSISSKNVLLKCYWILCEKPLKDISLMWQILHWCEGRSKS